MEAHGMDKSALAFLAMLTLTFIAGLAIPVLMVSSKRLGRLSRASLKAGIKHKWAAVTVALLLCLLATLYIVVSRVFPPRYFDLGLVLGRLAAPWTALLFSTWLFARGIPSWRYTSVPQRALLAASFAWAIALLIVA